MNTLETYSIVGPFGKTEDCAKIVVDDVTMPFVLRKVTTANQNYTFGCWIMSDTAGLLTAADCVQETSATWSRFETSFTATGTDLALTFGVIGTYYLYHSQLELGTIATDWVVAPEDTDDKFKTTEDLINERTTELSQRADGLDLTISGVDEKVDGIKSDIYKHFSFSEDGLVISAGENQMSIRIDNDIIIFEKNGVFFGWWDGIDFHTGNIAIDVTERAQFGNFAFVPRSDGSLSFLKVEHKSGMFISNSGGIMAVYGAYPSLEDTTLNLNDLSGVLEGTTLILGGE